MDPYLQKRELPVSTQLHQTPLHYGESYKVGPCTLFFNMFVETGDPCYSEKLVKQGQFCDLP